jgi:two-component system OmpR family sensor kinase
VTDRFTTSPSAQPLVPIEVEPAGAAIDPNAPETTLSAQYWTPPQARPDFSPPPLSELPEQPVLGPPPPRSAHRWRFVPRTLTSRLVVGVVALVVLVVLAAGGATYAALGSFLTQRLDQQVGAAADANSTPRSVGGCITSAPLPCTLHFLGTSASTTSSNEPSLRGSQSHMWVALLAPGGQPLTLTPDSADLIVLALTPAQRQAILSSPTTYRSITQNGQSVRFTSRPINTSAGTFYEVVGLSRDDVSNTLERLIVLELYIGAGAVIVALAATSIGVRLSLRPLHRVTTTARAVTAELSPEGAGLDRRVPVTEPNTEVGQLAESVNTLLGAVGTQFAARVESEQRMRQFMADASHELRTPLTSIRGYAELARMQRAFDDEGDPAQSNTGDAEALDRIEHEGTRMSRLVEDLLTLARGDIGAPIESVPVDVSEVIDDAVEGAQAAHPDRPFSTDALVGTMVRGDHDQLLRVVRNLVTNAAVHTAPGRPIRVTATREVGEVVIRVVDGGPGLPPEQAAHVFERFWRSDQSRARSSGGSGLGLAIVASIVAAHGGTVRFESSVDAGSVVTVSLPAR